MSGNVRWYPSAFPYPLEVSLRGFCVEIISWRELQQLQVPFTFPLSAALILSQRYAQLAPHVLQMNWNKSGICPTVRERKRKKITAYKIFHASPTSLVLPSFWHGNLIVFCLDILGHHSGFHSPFLTWLWVSWETTDFASQWKLNITIQTQRTSMDKKKMWPQNGDFFDATSARSCRGIWVRKTESMSP